MPKKISFFLDENIPLPLKDWLVKIKSSAKVTHANEIDLSGKPDQDLFTWSIKHQSTLITFDEDFTDKRLFGDKKHFGIIRLKIWPTSIEESQKALQRLFEQVSDKEITKSVIIIDHSKIRIRSIR